MNEVTAHNFGLLSPCLVREWETALSFALTKTYSRDNEVAMPRKAGAAKERFTLWLPTETLRQLERMARATGKESLAEVVREAIQVYASLHRAREQGVELFYESPETGEKGRIWLLPGPPPQSHPPTS